MEKAKELLTQKKHKIHKVSQMVGYEDCGYFGKLFKRYTGMQPSAYQDFIWKEEARCSHNTKPVNGVAFK
jgi:YesN/AraC family two-component response regulator